MPTTTTTAANSTVAPRNTVRFARRLNLGDYNHIEASITVEFTGDPIADTEQFEINARKAFYEAKGLVYSEVGAEFAPDSDDVLRELFDRPIPGVQLTTSVAAVPNITGTHVPVMVEGGQLLGEYEGYPVKLSHSKFGPFLVWGDEDSPQASGGKAFTANVATWDCIVEPNGEKTLAPGGTVGAPYTLPMAVKQLLYKQSKAA